VVDGTEIQDERALTEVIVGELVSPAAPTPTRLTLLAAILLVLALAGLVHLATMVPAGFVLATGERVTVLPRQRVADALVLAARLVADGQSSLAHEELRGLHREYPEEPNINRELGWVNLERGLWEFADEYFQLAAERAPENSKLNFYRGELERRRGEKSLAEAKQPARGSDGQLQSARRAIEFFQKARDFFVRSVAGPVDFDESRANKVALDCARQLATARIRRALLLRAKGRGVFGVNRETLQRALAEVSAVLEDSQIDGPLREQANRLERQMREEL